MTGCWINRHRRCKKNVLEPLKDGDEICLTHALQTKDDSQSNFISFIFHDYRRQGGTPGIAEMEEIGIMQEYKFGETLGRGSFGVVVLASHNDSGEERAIKIVDKKTFLAKGGQAMAMFDEAQMLGTLSHPFIIRIKEAIDIPQATLIAFEYAPLGDLASYIQARKRGAAASKAITGGAGAGPSAFNEDEAHALFWQILQALEYLHSMGCVHRNLTPENILLSHNSEYAVSHGSTSLPILKLAGFTNAHMLGHGPMTTYCGTPLYIAPEMIHLHLMRGAAAAAAADAPSRRGEYGVEVDLWSAGVILFQLLCDGAIPFTSQAHILRGLEGATALGLRFPPSISANAEGLVNKLLTKPRERLSAQTAIEHAWFRTLGSINEVPVIQITTHAHTSLRILLLGVSDNHCFVRGGRRATQA
jgi:serine/threonine protein kinase